MAQGLPAKRWLTCRDVQAITGLSRSASYELMHSLGCFRVLGRSTRLPKARLDAYMRRLEWNCAVEMESGTFTAGPGIQKPTDVDESAKAPESRTTALRAIESSPSKPVTRSSNLQRLDKLVAESRSASGERSSYTSRRSNAKKTPLPQ